MSPSGPGGQEQGWLGPGAEPAQNMVLLPLENSLKLRRTPQLEGLGGTQDLQAEMDLMTLLFHSNWTIAFVFFLGDGHGAPAAVWHQRLRWRVYSRLWRLYSRLWRVYSRLWRLYSRLWRLYSRLWRLYSRLWRLYSWLWRLYSRLWRLYSWLLPALLTKLLLRVPEGIHPYPRDLITSPGALMRTVPASLPLLCWRVITKPRSAKA
ncbi:uncharacterized protein LOC122432910 [Cervus canadensis]|uniref:uncharacterized protein LOC122432910 n=1 Tax=Cervus canadensis TaxID=1574408 RepID=UPI001CA37122|nr:uncharacterized protein LOC122432910 [Cervus canadensis]